MFIEGNVIYSYGHHFPLAIRKDWGAGITHLIRVREDNFSDVIGDRLYTLALIRRQRRRAPQTSQHYRWLFFEWNQWNRLPD